MMDLFADHCEVVNETLSGKRVVDEQTLASVAILNDRLERVKKLGSRFSRIEFSPDVRQLKNHSNGIIAV